MFDPLDFRKQAILRAVCTEHIARAEPVGSELLANQYAFGVRPATLRNEMAEMTDLGYLRQPHTSAGRIPSDRGYRFYVDRLMAPQPLGMNERRAIRRLRDHLHQQVDEILREACRVVAELTRYTSVATPPIVGESRLRQVRLLCLDPRRALVVLVLDSGRVESQVLDLSDLTLSESALQSAQQSLEAAFAGRSCREISLHREFPNHEGGARLLLERIASVLHDVLAPLDEDEIVVQGEINAVREPEFHDITRLDRLLDILHSRQAIYQLLSGADSDLPVAVIIGSESGYEKAREYSLVAARYRIGGTVAGAIGVLGPTRMRYSYAVPVVRNVARQVSAVLTQLAGG